MGNQAVLQFLQARDERPDVSQMPVDAAPSITIQPKLTINTPGDSYEQEADHIAEQVMRMPGPQLQRVQTKQVGTGDAAQSDIWLP